MPRNIRPLGWRDRRVPLPQDDQRTQASLDAEARVRADGAMSALLMNATDDGHLSNDDWFALDEKRWIDSIRLGRLPDIEVNRLAARAADVMGWPMHIMTGTTLMRADRNSCGMNLRQMASVLYDPTLHRHQTEEEWEETYSRQRRINRAIGVSRMLIRDGAKVLP